MILKCGIVGLPNVGKSTLFNALTSSSQAVTANYPFCTIEPNISRVLVPDNRLKILKNIAGSQKQIPAQIEFIDIAGLVKGSHHGEGLGNRFLSYIREVDAIIYMLRCFDSNNISHIENTINPIRDAEIIELELMLADIQSLTKQLHHIEKKARQDKYYIKTVHLINQILKTLNEGRTVNSIINDHNYGEIKLLNLLTSKPFLYVCNINENNKTNNNKYLSQIKLHSIKQNTEYIAIAAKIESEISTFTKGEDKKELLYALGLQQTVIEKIIFSTYKLLKLITYFTVGNKEVHAWTIKKGSTVHHASGIIHTDFQRGFICAEIINYKDFIHCGGEQQARISGKIRQEGKHYIVQDGDIILFRFNV